MQIRCLILLLLVAATLIVHSIAFRIGRWEPTQTEDQWLDWYARLLPSISSVGKGGGCVERTPLAGMTADVRRVGRTMAISFRAKP